MGGSIIKKIGIAFLILLAGASSLSAESDWHFLCDAVDQHTEILWGFLPTYLYGGVGYRGFQLLDENTTDIQLLFGAGYIQRKLWQDPVTGEDTLAMREHPITYDVLAIEWGLKFKQGFFHSPWDIGSDLLTVTLGYEEDLLASALITEDWTWTGEAPAREAELAAAGEAGLPLAAKIRYRQPDQACHLNRVAADPDAGAMRLDFALPQKGIAPGQAVVVYRGDTVIGGGSVRRAL